MADKSKRTLQHRVADGVGEANQLRVGMLTVEANRALEEFYRFNTEAARSAFAGRWLIIIASQLEVTWPAVYELLAVVKEKELFKRPDCLRNGTTFETFEDFFTAVMGQPFGRWAELEGTYQFARQHCPHFLTRTLTEARNRAQEMAADPEVKALAKPGAPAGNRNAAESNVENKVDNVHVVSANRLNSNSAERIIRRLKRDAPEIAEALARGEYPSARAAAIEAGIVKVPTALEQVKRLLPRLTDAEAAEVELLLRQRKGER